jgi:WD40 repeat protein
VKTLLRIGFIFFFGLLLFAVYKYWLQPKLVAGSMKSSVPDCVYAADVGAAGAGNVEFSPDGKLLAVESNRRRSILDAHSGKEVCDFSKSKEKTYGFCFSADSRQIAYADESVIRIKSSQGELISEIDISEHGKLGFFSKIYFVPKEDAVAFTFGKGVFFYKFSGEKIARYSTDESLRFVTVGPDGKSILASDWKAKVYRWNRDEPDSPQTVPAHIEYLARATVSPDGLLLATHGRDHTNPNGDFELKIWDTKDLSLVHAIAIGKGVTDFSFDVEANYLLVSKSTGEAIAFETKTAEVAKIWLMPRGIATSDISPDGKYVAFGLSKKVTTIDTNTHRDFVKGNIRYRRKNGQPIPYQTIKGQSVSPGAVLVLESKIDEVAQ